MTVSNQRSEPKRALTLLDAIADPALFKPFFKNPRTWATWFAIIAAIFALPMTAEQLAIYRKVTGRTEPPTKIAKEAWLCIGRRGGKSRVISLIAVFLACFFDYRGYLAPGEKGVVQIIASDRRQARTCARYVKAFIQQVPMLAEMIESETKESISLSNDIVIEVQTASFRSVRGFTVVACLLDEIAFFRTDEDAANPDSEIVAAVRPATITIPNSMLLAASSPYAKRGMLYEMHKAHFGKDGDPILVVQADTSTVNPAADAQIIADAYAADASSASAEFGALFRSDIETYIQREVVEACIRSGVYERGYQPGLKYVGFVDPSGGSSDSFTLAIAHRDADNSILDALREVAPPFSPEAVCAEYAQLLAGYRIKSILGDRYAGLWPVEQFAKLGIKYEQAARPKSDLYRDLLPLLNSRRAELLDNKRLLNQLCNLERRTARGGRDSIDHSPNTHDDLANCVAGAMTMIAVSKSKLRMFAGVGPGTGTHATEIDPRTLRPLPRELSIAERNGCVPGKAIDPKPWFDTLRGLQCEAFNQRGPTRKTWRPPT